MGEMMRFNRRRRNNGNLYPLTAEDRAKRGSYKQYQEEFPGIERRAIEDVDTLIARETREVARLSKEVLDDLARPRTLRERITIWFRRNFGGSPIGGDRLL